MREFILLLCSLGKKHRDMLKSLTYIFKNKFINFLNNVILKTLWS